MARPKTTQDPPRCFDSSPQVIRVVVTMYMKYPLSLPNWEAPSPLRLLSRTRPMSAFGAKESSPTRSGREMRIMWVAGKRTPLMSAKGGKRTLACRTLTVR